MVNSLSDEFSEKHLFHFPDFSFYFFRPLGIKLIFIRGKFAEQSQKLSGVYTFLICNVFEYFYGELVIGDSASCKYN